MRLSRLIRLGDIKGQSQKLQNFFFSVTSVFIYKNKQIAQENPDFSGYEANLKSFETWPTDSICLEVINMWTQVWLQCDISGKNL